MFSPVTIPSILSFIPLLGLFLGACNSTVDAPNLNIGLGAPAETTTPPTPRLESLPARYPYATVAIRGEVPGKAAFVIIKVNGLDNPYRAPLHPETQKFCQEIPLTQVNTTYRFSVQAQSTAGKFSDSAATQAFVYDPKTPPPAGVSLCDGGVPTL